MTKLALLAVEGRSPVASYLPMVPYLLFVVGMVVVLMVVPLLLAKKTTGEVKEAPYECGVPAIGSARQRFSVHFYVVAVLFILFDIEVVFLYPWAVAFKQLGLYGLVEMLLFILILLVGYVYLLKKRALEWD
jgi:NADH-quinone oxidoreductase subunit A